MDPYYTHVLSHAGSSLATRQYSPPVANCTEGSFGNPIWYVDKFTYPATAGTEPSFDILTNIFGIYASCGTDISVRDTSEEYWHSCSGTPGATQSPYYHFDPDTGVLQINQTWICDDRNPEVPITFSALGQTVMTRCKEPDCASSKARINGTLTQPFSITPQIGAAPKSHNISGCTKNSTDPSWTINNYRYEERFLNQWTGGYTSIKFDLTSHVLNTTISCGASTSNDGINTVYDMIHVWSKCDYPGDFYAINHYATYTYGAFDKGNNSLLLNQTWQCDDEGVENTFQFDWTAAETIPSTCTESGRPNIPGYQKNCTAPNFDLSQKWLKSIQQLPVGAPDRPKPVDAGASCTVESLVNQYFLLHGGSVYHKRPEGYLNSNPPDIREGMQIWLIVPGRNGPQSMRRNTFQPLNGAMGNPNTWTNCTVDEYYKEDTAWCAWKYDNRTKHFVVNYAWPCSDKDPDHPITFSATASLDLPWNCTTITGGYRSDGEYECKGEYDAPDVVMPFDEFTWTVKGAT